MKFLIAPLMLTFLILLGCATPGSDAEADETHSGLTHGNVQLTLQKGKTTQQDVLEAFGAPNITTIDSSGQEVWTYQRHATVSESKASGAYGTIILFGGSSRTTGFEQSSRTMTLIIKFDNEKRVSDFSSMATSF